MKENNSYIEFKYNIADKMVSILYSKLEPNTFSYGTINDELIGYIGKTKSIEILAYFQNLIREEKLKEILNIKPNS